MSTDEQAKAEQFAGWCRRLKASDRSAYERVFRALHDPLFRYALYITRSEAAARDVLQDAFLQLWDMRERLDLDQSLEALLYRMVRNRAYNHQRNRRSRAAKRASLSKADTASARLADAPDAALSAKTLDSKLQAWIDELPERQHEALVLSRFKGLSHAEIASVMDISPRTVNNHVVRALKTLRSRLQAFEPNLLVDP